MDTRETITREEFARITREIAVVGTTTYEGMAVSTRGMADGTSIDEAWVREAARLLLAHGIVDNQIVMVDPNAPGTQRIPLETLRERMRQPHERKGEGDGEQTE